MTRGDIMYSTLFEETNIGSIHVRNHFLRSATAEGEATDRGYPTGKIKNYYIELAKSGIGTIITSYAYIADYEQPSKNQLGIFSNEHIPYYKEITKAVHENNGKIVMQIVHGSSLSQANMQEAKILGPSAVKNYRSGVMPKEMTVKDFADVKQLFVDAALRVKKSGFDGVQIHVAHGYLLSQFLSPILNSRTDEYGGSWENRIRYILEICHEVKQTVGDFPVWVKINSSDEVEGGLTSEDFLKMAEVLANYVDAIEVSGDGWPRHSEDERAYYKDAAIELAKKIDIPVILTGGLREKVDIEDISENSKVNLFGFSRPLIKDINFLDTLK